MDSSTRKDWPIGVFIAAAVVVMASFMPWVTLKQSLPFGNLFLGGMPMNVSPPSPNAWNSNVTFMAITVPNWFVVGIACLAGFATWASTAGRWNAPRGLLLGLPIYGLCHTAFVIVMIATSNGTGLGFGLLLAFLA
ncbi:MAG: hypothetical protein O2955_18065, partial [Planctomycetota bacterium]|nr:hypothetical protein [Planctomycetota bacterium]